ncbi:MAG: 8-amino-7-oxononanoate synthase [Phycisphaerae bacterium]|nr:8-amino-7-oxononanoate synthase [Phycisphaerae bacterium]
MLDNDYKSELTALKQQGMHRVMPVLESGCGREIVVGGCKKLAFCSNNYLGLTNDPRLIQAVKDAADQWGFGAGGSRLICGNNVPAESLQHRLASWLRKEASLVFTSGYATNTAILTTLSREGDLLAIDKQVHASIVDGVRSARGTWRTWGHRQLDKLTKLLDRRDYKRAFIITDSLFSMDGDIAPLVELAQIKAHYNAVLMVDEAHAIGTFGPKGAGLAEKMEVLSAVDIYIGTLSKALGGSGGFVAGSQTIIDTLINRARGFIFTTGIPAVNCLAAEAALDIIAAEPERAKRLITHASYFRDKCRDLGLAIGDSESYIIPVILGEPQRALEASKLLYDAGFMVPAIRPPTVKPQSCRLRISLMSEHTQEDMDGLLEQLTRFQH